MKGLLYLVILLLLIAIITVLIVKLTRKIKWENTKICYFYNYLYVKSLKYKMFYNNNNKKRKKHIYQNKNISLKKK